MKNWLGIGCAVLLLSGCSKKQTMDGEVDFTIKDLNGKSVQLSQFRGKTVLLNIWATWCGPCKKEIPDLVQLHNETKDKNIVILGVLLESESAEAAKPIVESFAVNYPTWYGDQNFAELFKVEAFPTTVIFDPSGRVKRSMIGQQSKDRFVKALRDAGAEL